MAAADVLVLGPVALVRDAGPVRLTAKLRRLLPAGQREHRLHRDGVVDAVEREPLAERGETRRAGA